MAVPEEQQNPILRKAGISPTPAVVSPIKTTATSTTSTTTTKKVAVEPTTPGPLNSVLDSVKAGISEASANSKIIQAARTNQARYQTVAAEATISSAKDAQIIENVKNVAILDKEANAQKLFNAGGGVEHLKMLMEGLKKAQRKSLKEQKDVEKLIDEPGLGGVIRRALWLDGQVEEANVAEASKIKYKEAIRDFTGAASSVENTLNQLKTTVTTASLAATSDKLAQDAAYKAAMNMSAAEEANALAATQALNDNKYQAAAAIDMYKLKMQAVSEAETSKIRNAQITALERDEAGVRMISAIMRKGYIKMGVSVADENDPAAMEEEHIKFQATRKIPDTAARANRAFSVGSGVVAPTPAETFEAIRLTNATTLTDGSNKANTFLYQNVMEADAEINQAKAEGKLKGKVSVETYNEARNKKTEAAWRQANGKILSSDLDNPNHAIPLSALIALPGLKDLPLSKILKKTLDEADVKDLSVEKVAELGLAAVRTKGNPKGKLSFEQWASDMAAIYTQAAHINTQTQNRLTLGYPPQVSYNAKFKDVEGFKISTLRFPGLGLKPSDNIINVMDTTELKALGLRILNHMNKGPVEEELDFLKGLLGTGPKSKDILLPEDAVKIGAK